jgi:hypothetical protein
MTNKLAVIIATSLLAACSSNNAEPLSPDPSGAVIQSQRGDTFELRAGQTANIGTGALVVGFRGVTQDSRCPSDVTCVWAGDGEVAILATVGRMAWTPFSLHTGVEPRSAKFREFTITVVDLKPTPRSGQKIPPGDYVVTLRVQ